VLQVIFKKYLRQYNCITYTDVNECLKSSGACSVYAWCSNTAGSFTCSCLPGYVGDGFTCRRGK